MASIKKISTGRKDLFLIDPTLIKTKDDWNVRLDTQELRNHINELALSISEIGVQQPLTVYMEDDDIYVSDGHCRLRAVLIANNDIRANIKSVPCRVEERYANEADRSLSMITRNSGKPLSPLEKATVVKKLLMFGWPEKEIAVKIGMSIQSVNRLLEMSAIPEEMKNMVSAGQVSASLALDEVKSKGPENALNELKAAVKKEPTRKVTRKSIKPKINPVLKAIALLLKEAERRDLNELLDALMDLDIMLTEEMNYDKAEDY